MTDRSLPRSLPQRVPETRPTALQGVFIYLSIAVLVCGATAITALELGVSPRDPVVRVPLLIGGALLIVVAVDALVRIWRSVQAWLPLDRGRAMFRVAWMVAIVGGLALLALLALPLLFS